MPSIGGSADRNWRSLIPEAPPSGSAHISVTNPADGSEILSIPHPSQESVEVAVAGTLRAFQETRLLPVHVRAEALVRISDQVRERADELALLNTLESGKPLKWSCLEVARTASLFRWLGEEIRRGGGELRRLDTEPPLERRLGIVQRFPIGPVLGIAASNFPLLLAAHKVGPALAVGAPVLLKAPPDAPLSALALGELVRRTELPHPTCSVLTLDAEPTEELVRDPRLPVVSFTGSVRVGWHLRRLAPEKRMVLELGGNAAAIVHSDADIEFAAARIATGGYYHAGQSCISVQRIFVHERVHGEFLDRLVDRVGELRMGDPRDPTTDVGPVMNESSLGRIDAWVQEAVAAGARVVVGGRRADPFYSPTILTHTHGGMNVRCEELFAPVTTVTPYATFDEALDLVNESRFGLQAGIFTRDIDRAFRAHRDLVVGGVIVNDVPSFRADQLPYGGTKQSGVGREGPRSSLEELTEERVLILSDIPL